MQKCRCDAFWSSAEPLSIRPLIKAGLLMRKILYHNVNTVKSSEITLCQHKIDIPAKCLPREYKLHYLALHWS
ncbi:hypothetical protein [Persicobacter diffluens]|uniref:hypothetical protein n=1 Tax=Persicobacter diffluens TaxID=981 RepID=UPI0030C7378D